MLHELEPADADAVVPLFGAPHMALVARAVACGNGPGQFWTDDPVSPRVALLWDKRHHLYLAGDAAAAGPAAVGDLLHRTILPGMLAVGCSRYQADASCNALLGLWGEVLPVASRRRLLLLRSGAGHAPAAVAPLEAGMQLRPIDESLLRENGLGHVQDVRNEVAGMWGSVEAFLRGGFGYCIASEREIVCWCTAEHVSPGWCGVGIETISEYQRRGLATAAATAFLSHCVRNGIRMHWDCWADNAPSVRVAETIGLDLIERYEVACGTIVDLQRRMRPADA